MAKFKPDTHLKLVLRRKKAKRERLGRPLAPRAPIPLERSYMRDLIPYCQAIAQAVHTYIIPALPSLVRNNEEMRPNALKTDALDLKTALAEAIDRTLSSVATEFSEEDIRAIAAKKGIEVSQWNRQIIQRNLARVTGVDIFWSEPWLAVELANFTDMNSSLILEIQADTMSDISKTIYSGVQQGTRWEDLADQINEMVDPLEGRTRNRAKLIARDQVSKLNGQLNMLRQGEAGVEKYVWRTVGDERVRHSHEIKEGNVYSWDDPPADTGHPGQDYQCRCWAEPYLDDLIPSLDDDDEA